MCAIVYMRSLYCANHRVHDLYLVQLSPNHYPVFIKWDSYNLSILNFYKYTNFSEFQNSCQE